MTFLIESFIACAVFTLFVFLMSRDPVKTIFNYRCGALTAYALWCVVDWFDAIVLDCLWFCHDKHFVINGTEDMVMDYHDYWFHIKGSLVGMVLAIPAALIAGIIVIL